MFFHGSGPDTLTNSNVCMMEVETDEQTQLVESVDPAFETLKFDRLVSRVSDVKKCYEDDSEKLRWFRDGNRWTQIGDEV